MNRPPLQAAETMVGGERLAVLVWVLGENVLLGLARGRNVTQTHTYLPGQVCLRALDGFSKDKGVNVFTT